MEQNFQTEVLARLAVIESKLDSYKDIKRIVYETDHRSKQNEEDIKEMKDNNKWLRRTIIAEVIGLIGLAAAIFIGLK